MALRMVGFCWGGSSSASVLDVSVWAMDKWTWRQHVAHWIHQLAYKFDQPECQDVLIRDESGAEIFNIAFEGGFVASGPCEPYTAHSREYADDADMIGTIVDW